MLEALKRWRAIVERVFPENARVLEVPPRDHADAETWRLLVSWRLGCEPARRNKRSKTVRIEIGSEALQDYCRSPPGARPAADERFEDWLRRELDRFDADHDKPPEHEPPVVPWIISTLELNG